MKKSWVKKGLAIGIIMLFLGTSVASAFNTSFHSTSLNRSNSLSVDWSRPENPPVVHVAMGIHNPPTGGWLEEIEGVRILHLNGSYYDMGYSHGFLLKEEIQANMRILFDYFHDMGFSNTTLLQSWNTLQITYQKNSC